MRVWAVGWLVQFVLLDCGFLVEFVMCCSCAIIVLE